MKFKNEVKNTSITQGYENLSRNEASMLKISMIPHLTSKEPVKLKNGRNEQESLNKAIKIKVDVRT